MVAGGGGGGGVDGWGVVLFSRLFIPSVAAAAGWKRGNPASSHSLFGPRLKCDGSSSTSQGHHLYLYYFFFFFCYPDDYDRNHPSKVRAKILFSSSVTC